MRSWLFAIGACAVLAAGCASNTAADDAVLDDLFSGGRLKGAALERALKAAQAHPLGSQKNPVRTHMPAGQQEYLSRLRCPDKSPPEFERVGNVGRGPFGSIVDLYELVCPGAAAKPPISIYMDMYHPEHEETAAPQGFTLEPKVVSGRA